MEKDYFKDRHPICQDRNSICRGDKVFICLKKAQTYAKYIDDLTLITVTANLTSQANHPRGQKVKGIDENGEEHVGRVTYKLFDKNKVLTTDGYKYVAKRRDGYLCLVNQEDIKGKYSLYLVFKYEIFEFEVLFEPFLFFQYDEIQDFVNKQNINSAKIAGGDIFYKNFDKEYQEKEYISLYNEKVVKNEEVFKFMCANYNSSNNSNYNYNKEYNLSFLGVRAEEQ